MAAKEASSQMTPDDTFSNGADGDMRPSAQPATAADPEPDLILDEYVDLDAGPPEEGLSPVSEPYLSPDLFEFIDADDALNMADVRDQASAPDEFSFSINDLDGPEGTSLSDEESRPERPKPPAHHARPGVGPSSPRREAGASSPQQLTRSATPGHELARTAVATDSAIQAAGLIAAVVPVVLYERMNPPLDERLLSIVAAAAAKMAYELHRRPGARAQLERFPEIIDQLASTLQQRMVEGHPIAPQPIFRWMARRVEQLMTHGNKPLRRQRVLRGERRSVTPSDRLERYLAEWWDDEDLRA